MVIVSNGFSKFPLAVAAVELYKRGMLSALITGAYPKRTSRIPVAVASRLPGKARRFLARGEAVPDALVRPMWLSEVDHEIALAAARWSVARSRRWSASAYSLYGVSASRVVARLARPGMVYHYRSGFGGRSVAVAKQRGMLTLCDHSIAHPAVIGYLTENDGQLPDGPIIEVPDPFWSLILEDVRRSDHVLVNSDFVKTTFVRQGYPSDRIHVIYAGPDDAFLAAAERCARSTVHHGPVRLLFVGTVERRKGAEVLFGALEESDDLDWRLAVIGAFKDGIAERYRGLLCDPRVTVHGTVDRLALAEHMSRADVFVFPSLAEGSARVIPMAMACGCFVIATPNSGSVVEHGLHGLLVPPGDVGALRAAIAEAASDRDRLRVVGDENRRFVLRHLRQERFGDDLAALYQRLIGAASDENTTTGLVGGARP